MKPFTLIFKIVALILILFFILLVSIKPSNNRNWNSDQVLPYAEIDGDLVRIHNIRNFTYRTANDFDIAYYDKTFDLNKIKTVDYIVEPFSGFVGAAHTFLSFEFEDNQHLAISVEIRKEKGESFSAVKGLFNQYELMYVFGDENDLVKLRTNIRKDDVYVYPTVATKERARELFLDMVERANKLKEKPEFYNTLWNTCTTNIVSHVNKFAQKKIPWSYKILLPAYSDEYAYSIGILNTDLLLVDARKKYHINDRAVEFADSPLFSQKIRIKGVKPYILNEQRSETTIAHHKSISILMNQNWSIYAKPRISLAPFGNKQKSASRSSLRFFLKP